MLRPPSTAVSVDSGREKQQRITNDMRTILAPACDSSNAAHRRTNAEYSFHFSRKQFSACSWRSCHELQENLLTAVSQVMNLLQRVLEQRTKKTTSEPCSRLRVTGPMHMIFGSPVNTRSSFRTGNLVHLRIAACTQTGNQNSDIEAVPAPASGSSNVARVQLRS